MDDFASDIVTDLESICPNHKVPVGICSKGGPWTVQCTAHDAIDEIIRLRTLVENLQAELQMYRSSHG